MLRKISFTLLALVALLIIYLSVTSSPIEPAAYSPPNKTELTGALTPNQLLGSAELLAQGKIYGPEDVDVDREGRIYGGTQDGKILRVNPDGSVETFAVTNGRPLGLHFDHEENLIVCDAYKGLLAIDQQGSVKTLATEAEGTPFKFTDDLDIASDGTIYFSDASSKFAQNEYLFDLLEAKPYGRLMSYDPLTGKVNVLLKDIYFANGVALSQNEDFVLVNETYRYRITRYWLQGPKAGTADIFIANLPGFPDGISSNRRGTFWLAMFTVRNDAIDRLHPSPFIKKSLSKLPRFMWPKPRPYGFVLGLNEAGNIVQSLHEPTGEHLKEITSVQEHDGYLYLGSLHNDRIGKYKLP